jgi:ribosomal silencing factor RsfS
LDHKESVEKIIEWAADKKAEDVIHLDVKGKTDFTDSIIICNGTAELHVKRKQHPDAICGRNEHSLLDTH